MKIVDLPQVLALSAKEKLQLVDDLWLSVGPELESLEVSNEEKHLLDQRWAAFVKNRGATLSAEQFQAKMTKLRR
jgi:putative addiction module component (TIGR02574 family)